MKLQYIPVFNGVRNGIGVQPFLKNTFGGLLRTVRISLFIIYFNIIGVRFKNGGARKAK